MRALMILALLTGQASAAVLGTITNQAGNEIELTDESCGENAGNLVMAQLESGSLMVGCWFKAEEWLLIKWSDGDIRRYPYNVIKPTQYLKDKYGKPEVEL